MWPTLTALTAILAAPAHDIYEFDNGVKIARSHLMAAQVERYGHNDVALHEPHEEEWFSSLIFGATRGSIFLDVGAAAGYYCLLALRLRPRMAAVAINPSAHFRKALLQNAALQAAPVSVMQPEEDQLGTYAPTEGAILQLPVAVAAQPGRIDIGSEYGSHVSRKKEAAMVRVASGVPALTLRQVLALFHDTYSHKIHLAMFDVQGEEKNIFASTEVRELLARHAIDRVMVGIHDGQPTMNVVRSTLVAAGYNILLAKLSVPAQPDGVVIALAPNISKPLKHD